MSPRHSFNSLGLGDCLDQIGLGGETYLTRAIKMGQHDAVEEFLNLGCNPNVKNAAGEYPIYIALAQKDETAITLLFRADASVFIKKDGMTFRQHAEKAGLADIAETAASIERREAAMRQALSFPRGMS
ncbi:MAG: ankyrin repeat domain-containing protein [Alphaproteobacteria bacterium]|nr:ankyrin repeat domain-containing protein [Alphaproteobacteria bacterium]